MKTRNNPPHPTGPAHPNWRGGRTVSAGYVKVRRPKHPRATRGYVYEHMLVAERALGHPLPERAVVHHVNEDTGDNRGRNLVVCQDQGYHKLLHLRAKALAACGHPDWRRCRFCGEWDEPGNLYVTTKNTYHNACQRRYSREQRWQRGARPAPKPMTDEQVIEARRSGERTGVLAKRYGLSPSRMSSILTGRSYGHLPYARKPVRPRAGEGNASSRLTAEKVREIRASDASHAALGRKYGVAETTIAAVRKRINWRHV